MEKEKQTFLIFATLQAVTLGFIIFFVLDSLTTIGKDTQVILSILFPLFSLITAYMTYSKK